MQALQLLERPSGPVLEDYPHDAAGDDAETTPVACPVNFFTPPALGMEGQALLLQNFRTEAATMKTWHAISCEKTARSTAGISGLDLLGIAELFTDFVTNTLVDAEVDGQRLSDVLRVAAEDLRTYYFEAASAQPGQSTNPMALADWFWGETCAARVINEVRKGCLKSEAKDMLLVGKLLLIPRNQMHRVDESSSRSTINK